MENEPIAENERGLPSLPVFPPWKVWEALLVLTLFTITQLVVTVVVAWLMRWWTPVETVEGLRLHNFLRINLPLSLALSHLVGWFAIYHVIVQRHRVGFLAGLRLGGRFWPPALKAFLAGLVMQVLAATLSILVPPPPDFVSPVEEFLRMGKGAIALFFIMAVVLAPPLEEALFRGLLLPALRRRYNFVVSALVVTSLFTAMHATQTGTYWPPMAGIFMCGWALAWLRERSGTLWPSIAFHIGFNTTAFLPLFFLDAL